MVGLYACRRMVGWFAGYSRRRTYSKLEVKVVELVISWPQTSSTVLIAQMEIHLVPPTCTTGTTIINI